MPKNPLDPMRIANEESFFHKQNAELAEKLKARAGLEKAGIHDPSLADTLAKAGFDADSVRALWFVPVVEVAWADGRLQDDERKEIQNIVEARGIQSDSKAYSMIQGWLTSKPSGESFLKAKSLIDPILADARKAGSPADWILGAAENVAKATGGIFGAGLVGNMISADEQKILKKLSQKVSK